MGRIQDNAMEQRKSWGQEYPHHPLKQGAYSQEEALVGLMGCLTVYELIHYGVKVIAKKMKEIIIEIFLSMLVKSGAYEKAPP